MYMNTVPSTVKYGSLHFLPSYKNVCDKERKNDKNWINNQVEYAPEVYYWEWILTWGTNTEVLTIQHVNLEVWLKPERLNEVWKINVRKWEWMSESVDLIRADSAELVGKLRCWLECFATSQTFCLRRYDNFQRACRCRGALSSWW